MPVAHRSRSSGCDAIRIAIWLAALLFVPEHVWAQNAAAVPWPCRSSAPEGLASIRSGHRRAMCCGWIAKLECSSMSAEEYSHVSARARQNSATCRSSPSATCIPTTCRIFRRSYGPAKIYAPHRYRLEGHQGTTWCRVFQFFSAASSTKKWCAFPLLGGTISGRQDTPAAAVPLQVDVVDVTKKSPSTVFDHEGFTVTAQGIPHGNIPALAFRVATRGRSVVFSTDQNGSDPAFIEFAKGADVLVMHLAIAAGTTSPLHASPAVVGQVARDIAAKRLIVSHIGQFPLPEAMSELQKFYSGPVTVAADLQCTPVP